MTNSCCCFYCWRFTKVCYQMEGIVWRSLPHLWILEIYSSKLTQLRIPTRTLYAENLVCFVGILLMQKCIHVLWHGGKQKSKTFQNWLHFVRQILGISISQIEIERIFSILGVFIALRRCQLQTNNMYKFIFVHKNWPSNPFVLVV